MHRQGDTRSVSVLRRLASAVVLALACGALAPLTQAAGPKTPLQISEYRSLPKTRQVVAYLQSLATVSRTTRFEIVGRSAGGLPMAALFLSDDDRFPDPPPQSGKKLSVLLIGGQHGNESSGGEALQIIARDIALGPLAGMLQSVNLTIVPLANPDGRDRHRRKNANKINISTDFLVQTQPETRALTALIRRVRPHVILDIHESAIYKRRTLGAQGFMTDFETQFEVPTNPNTPPEITALGHELILPRLLSRLNESGLRANRYIGEITDVAQPATHGGLSLRNLRAYGGMRGALSMLLENRLDPRGGTYPTPRNIKARVGKQLLSIRTFLDVIEHQRKAILTAVARAQQMPKAALGRRPTIVLGGKYVADEETPFVWVPLLTVERDKQGRAKTGFPVLKLFSYHGRIVETMVVPRPRAYVVTAFQSEISLLLERHGIAFDVLSHGRSERVEIQHIEAARRRPIPYGKIGAGLEIESSLRIARAQLNPGDLWIDLNQPLGTLVPLMFDPRSATNIYQDLAFGSHIKAGNDHYALAVPE